MNRDELIKEITKYDSSFENIMVLKAKKNNNKWCRFCGAKLSSKWATQNKLILCDIHNKLYKENKSFKKRIDRFRKIPTKPIDDNENTECQYLKNKLKLLVAKQKRLRKNK